MTNTSSKKTTISLSYILIDAQSYTFPDAHILNLRDDPGKRIRTIPK
jgi:hypothetical protein